MPGRHARKPSVPLVALVVVLALLAGGAWFVTARTGQGADAGSAVISPAPPRSPASEPAGTGAGGGSGPPTRTSSPTPGPAGRLVIHGTGDVSLDPSYIPALRTNGYGWAWSGLGGLFREDDLTVINLECPATDIVAPIPKTFSFRCDPDALPVARRHGVEVANLGNNHGYDQGPEGLLDSIRNLRRAGIVPVGAGASAGEADAPRYVEVKGWRIAIVGVGEVIDPLDQVAVGDEPGTSVGHDFGRALRAIRRAERHADLVIVTIHWGVELDTEPREYQVEEARRMIRAGADIIFGHHAHRLQPMEVIDGKPVFYGLGNFVWPSFSVAGSTTAVARAVVRPDGTVRARLLPAYIESHGHPVLR